MSSDTTWTTVENAVATHGLETSLILKWADDGSIAAEHHDTRSMRVKSDDLIQKIQQIQSQDKIS